MQSSTISPVEVMKRARVIAVVGASKNPSKEAHTVPLYLKRNGFRVIPVNPTADEILEERAYPSLAELPESVAEQIDAVDVFRPSEELPEVARQVVELGKKHRRTYVFWAQLGLENDQAKKILNENDVPYVMNACMRVIHAGMGGVT